MVTHKLGESGDDSSADDSSALTLIKDVSDLLEGTTRGPEETTHGESMANQLKQAAGSMYENPDLTKINKEQLADLINDLTKLQAAVSEAHKTTEDTAAALQSKINAVLDTDQGKQIQRAREAFDGLIDEMIEELIPTIKLGRLIYDPHGGPSSIEDIDDPAYDPNLVFEANLEHYEEYPDNDAAYSKLVVRLDDNGELAYAFTGESLDPKFQAKVTQRIKQIGDKLKS